MKWKSIPLIIKYKCVYIPGKAENELFVHFKEKNNQRRKKDDFMRFIVNVNIKFTNLCRQKYQNVPNKFTSYLLS